jgi:ABC-type multidrug transport system ATPase subunit
MVMGLSPVVRWLVQATFWCALMYGYLCVGLILMLVFSKYTPTAAAVPAFALLSLLAVPPIFCFIALFNFIFWCRTNVEDVVSQTFCNLIVLVVLYPTLVLSAIPGVRDNTTAQSIITYALLVVPLNQLSFGLSAIYTVANVAIYTSAYVPGASGPRAADFLVWAVTNPISGGSSPGPLICMAASLVSAPFWFWALWRVDVRRYYLASNADGGVPHGGPRQEGGSTEDADVAAERRRVESGGADCALIRMVGLRKTFRMPKKNGKPQPDKVALDNLSLAIDGQGCFALLGPNGAGKTTALSVLTGDMRPTAGEAFVAGLSVRTQILDIFKLLGYCPQFGGLFPRGVTLKQHLVLYARLKGIAEADLEPHCARVMREFGLEEHAHKWVNYLSGGTRRKLMAAIALACEPRVCFLDEPTTGVDVGTRQFLWDRIKAKGRRGCALILTTHYMEEADALAQRIGILVNGRLQVRVGVGMARVGMVRRGICCLFCAGARREM